MSLEMWTVYDHPIDFPNSWIARRWVVQGAAALPTNDTIISPDLPALRRALPPGLVCIGREPADDPTIREVWL
jgi:hypothetical protein